MVSAQSAIAITGMGVVCSIARDLKSFAVALEEGRSGIVPLTHPQVATPKVAATVDASLREEILRERLEQLAAGAECEQRLRRILRSSSASLSLSLIAALEAILDAGLTLPLTADQARRTGVIIAGSNLHVDQIAAVGQRYREEGRSAPRYALTGFDSHQVGVISELLGIRGPGITVGAASASGNAAIFNAAQWLRSGAVERVLVVGASPGLSPVELEAFAGLGAASESSDPARACAPFDQGRSGFVWGEGSGALLLESALGEVRPERKLHGHLLGVSLLLDGNHLPDPSCEGEIAAMQAALEEAGLLPEAIDYVNAHGTASPLGDETERAALRHLFRSPGPRVNATKSLIGHCLSAAGVIEAIATLLQLNGRFAHPTLNLNQSIDPDLAFVGPQAQPLESRYGVSNSFGFGGFNSSLVLERSSLW